MAGAVAKGGGNKWVYALLLVAWTVHVARSDGWWEAIPWLAVLGLWLAGQYVEFPRRPSRWVAYALNWLLPAIALAGCARSAINKDYWGVAFWSIGLGFAVVNAVYVDPSARRTSLFRVLLGLFLLVSAAAVWKTAWP